MLLVCKETILVFFYLVSEDSTIKTKCFNITLPVLS